MRRVLFGCALSLLLFLAGALDVVAEDGVSRRQRRQQQFQMLEARGGSTEGGIRDLLASGGQGDGIRDLLEAGGGSAGIRDLLSRRGSQGIRDLLADEADRNIRDLLVKVSSSGGGIRDLLVKLSSQGGGGEIRDLLARAPKPSDTEGADLREWVLSSRRAGKIRDLLAAGEGPEGIRDLLAAMVGSGKIRDLLMGEELAKDATLRACLAAIADAPADRVRTVFGAAAEKLSLTLRPLLAAKASASGTGGIRDLLAAAETDPGIRDLLWDLSNASEGTVKALEMAIKGP